MHSTCLRTDLSDRPDHARLPCHLRTHSHSRLSLMLLLLLLLHQLLRCLLSRQIGILLHHCIRLVPTRCPLIHRDEMSAAGIRHLNWQRPLHLRWRHYPASLTSYADTHTNTTARGYLTGVTNMWYLLSRCLLLHLLHYL